MNIFERFLKAIIVNYFLVFANFANRTNCFVVCENVLVHDEYKTPIHTILAPHIPKN